MISYNRLIDDNLFGKYPSIKFSHLSKLKLLHEILYKNVIFHSPRIEFDTEQNEDMFFKTLTELNDIYDKEREFKNDH